MNFVPRVMTMWLPQTRAQPLAGPHRDARREPDFLQDHENNQRPDIARPIERLGVGRGLGQVEAQPEHEGQREKSSRARAKKPVIATDAEHDDEIKLDP